MALTIDEPTFFDNVLHYGLFLGALFQLVCIFAVIVLPKSDYEDERDEGKDVKDEGSGKSPHQSTLHQQPSSSKKNRKEKKKHR